MRIPGRLKFCLSMLLLVSFSAQAQNGFTEHTLASAGQTRAYLMFLPSGYKGEPVPLVFSFHGSGGVPRNQVDTSHFDVLAEQRGFAVVFPAGEFTNTITARSWNAGKEAGVDDVQLVRDIIEDVAGSVNIDRTRIYTSGMSGGGRISSRLACELSDVLAAAAPVAGLQYPDDCLQEHPIPIITFHGMADAVNEYAVSENSRPYWRMGVETALDKWRQANGCSLTNTAERLSVHVMFYSWTSCSNSAEIHFYQIDNGGHTWPGSNIGDIVPGLGDTNQEVNASALIWEFFSRHSLR